MREALKTSSYDWENLIADICQKIGKITGNVMSEKQHSMVESRMKRRCLDLKLDTPLEYKTFWMAHEDAENKYLIGLLTTHFTSFFREFSHFEWVGQELPQIIAAAKKEGRKTIKIWSAASSKGQEVWSLCMWLEHHMPKLDKTMNWTVLGSDIDAASVKEGENGVYHRRELETAPRHLWEGYWVKGKDDIADWYKIKNELKVHAKFQVMNLLSIKMPETEKFDLIMCRNVLIYFDRQGQETIAKSLMKCLTPSGTLITGMSESLSGYGLPIRSVSPSIYKALTAVVIELPVAKPSAVVNTSLSLPSPMKVLCIDDSPTVITIMKKILQLPHFEIVGVAKNGQEAIEALRTLKPDIITLDIHMPVMDGPTFLEKSQIAKSIPVVIVSSVGRDQDSLVAPLFNLGVMDFVEKPTLANINLIADELSQKLKMAWHSKKKNLTLNVQQPIRTKTRPAAHIVLNFGMDDKTHILHVLDQQKWPNDELSFVFSGHDTDFQIIKNRLQSSVNMSKKVSYIKKGEEIPSSALPTIWLHFAHGNPLPIKSRRKAHDFFVVEESPLIEESLKTMADDISPATSFSYLIDKLLGGE